MKGRLKWCIYILNRKINVSRGREGMMRCVRRRVQRRKQIVTDVRESMRDRARRQEEETRIIGERWNVE